jgi:hypothetical protein
VINSVLAVLATSGIRTCGVGMSSLRESVDERGRVVSLGAACVADPGGWGSRVDAEHLLEGACRELDS